MGAGDFPAGVGPAGFDPVYVAPPPAPVFTPRAAFYDPSIRRFLSEDENGVPIDMHPIDQIVVLRLTTLQGQSKSLTTLGTRLGILCARLAPAKLLQTARNEIQSELQDLITNRDILLISVAVSTPTRGQNIFKVSYVNLRDPATNPRYPTTQNQKTVTIVGVNQ